MIKFVFLRQVLLIELLEVDMRLVLEDIKKSYGEKEVLKGASFTFEKGKIYGLLGRNGVEKQPF